MAAGRAAGKHAVPLLLTEGDVKMMAHHPDRVMEDIQMRATQISRTLEAILHESHGQPRWGINE